MIVKYRGRPFRRIEASGYSTEQVEEMVDDERVSVETEAEAGDAGLRGSAPKPIIDKLEEIDNA